MMGEPNRSWHHVTESHGQCIWLRDALPKHVPGARVMLFSYDSGLDGNWNMLSPNWLTCIAMNLLKSIENWREQNNPDFSRPVAFIARGLGGVIVKKIFFETPHRPDDMSSWEDMILNILLADHSPTSPCRNISSRAGNLIKDVEEVTALFSRPSTTRHNSTNMFRKDEEMKVVEESIE
ncbi:hypothetical protein N656DRAFT_563851 [Canariomyces notabilis]|uniref:Uncharacterized protein n=1 Tax=Canariomyces notabilis TaxID=2074819 RepID=A0AAN6T7Q5_9PEZI|nr:hypothetical protein N656DRAFT_563851 [Canariomyces arenarius]